MKLALSNLALPPFDHGHLLFGLTGLGVQGIEVVPSHTWERSRPDSHAVAAYERTAAAAGLAIVGLHGLLAGRPDLGLFGGAEVRTRTIDHIVDLSAVCRDLGGRTLVLDSKRQGAPPGRQGWEDCRAFLEEVLPRIEAHGTALCFAPLAPAEGVFCATAKDCYLMVNAVEHPSFGLHLATAPLAASGETGHATFIVLNGRLDHIHLDEPGLLPLGTSGTVDHADVRRHLAAISYRNYATVVQRCLPAVDDDYALRAAAQAVAFAADHYLPVDTR